MSLPLLLLMWSTLIGGLGPWTSQSGLALAADLTYTIPEEQPKGSRVGNLAQDTDLTQYVSADSMGNLRYSFLAGEASHSALFHLDGSTGELRTSRSRKLDREQVCPYAKDCVLSLQVAIQSALNQFFKKVSVDVNVTDINDNAPTFPERSAEVLITEAVGIPSSFPLMSALDRDMGPGNGLKDYRLVPSGGPFGLSYSAGSPNLMLVVERGELDHERQAHYQVQVIARDGGRPPKSGTLLVNITIGDENDNRPRFTEPSYSATVDEDVPKGYVLMTLTATDEDSGSNGRVRYRLSPQQAQTVLGMFEVDTVSGELRVAGDIENGVQESYDVIVEATDMGAQPFTTSTTVTVTVRDTINSSPKMTVSLLAGGNGYSTISEYASLGAVVAHIAVKDADRGRNGIVQCELQRHPYFELQGFDVNEYKVIVARALDRETVAVHNVSVVCSDAGIRPLSASSTFEVHVLDENDNSPRFVQQAYHVYLSENTVQGRSITTIIATDKDAGDNGKVRYSLHPNARGRFIISPETGVLLTHDDFDYELETSFNFTVVATDQGKPPRSNSVEVMVSIIDINDQKPSFARDVFPFTVSELASPGKVIGRVTANDFEQGLNGQVLILPERYSTSGTPFTVLRNGSIVLTGKLDHEAMTYYYFRVIAVDQGQPPLNDTAEVQITVLDENDNRPTVTYPNGTELALYVSMDDDIARPVAMIKAQDPDSGLNGQIQFVITSRNDSGRFDVDSNSGEVFITRSLTLNDVSTYRLQVLVQDSGTPPLPADRTITVYIHAGNSTRGSPQGQVGDQYILITLAIVCITIILSAVIVLIIVIMRRMDRRRKPPAGSTMHAGNSRVLGTYSDRVKADNMHNESVDGGLGEKEYGLGGGGGGGGFETFGKGVCEEEEEFGFSTFTGGGGGGGGPDGLYGGGKSFCLAPGSETKNPEVTDSDPSPSTTQHPVSVSQDTDLDLETLQLHQVLLQSYQDSTAAAGEKWQPVVRQEDGQSDSSGETIPSDSGRGGSEEDISHGSSHVGAALNDDSRLAALHDASFTSSSTFPGPGNYSHPLSNPNPNKSSVRDPIRNSSRKHVTFKDLGAGKRALRTLTGPVGPAGSTSGGSGSGSDANCARRDTNGGPRSVGGGGGPGADVSPTTGGGGGSPSPRYTQLPNRDSPLHSYTGTTTTTKDTLSSPRGYTPNHYQHHQHHLQQQETMREVPRAAGSMATATGNATSVNSARSPYSLQDGGNNTRTVPTYVNEPYGNLQGSGSGSGSASSSPLNSPSSSKDWSRATALLQRDGGPRAQQHQQAPRSTFNTSQEMQTFVPPTCRAREGGGGGGGGGGGIRDFRPSQSTSACSNHPSKTSRESPLGFRGDAKHVPRDWHNDSLITNATTATDDYDDQRSTTTSGSYTIDNEDGYVGVELSHAPWKDVVV
ncbi:protocadherin-1-like [Babylonia areolata]|uniref:protocadherin-1-like n=1 Tax=Babylonia areolata TaxID=304850 RepID=UPI003FD519CD